LIRCTGQDLGVEPLRAARTGGDIDGLGDKGLEMADSADIIVVKPDLRCDLCIPLIRE
jgi:hypothetical protein